MTTHFTSTEPSYGLVHWRSHSWQPQVEVFFRFGDATFFVADQAAFEAALNAARPAVDEQGLEQRMEGKCASLHYLHQTIASDASTGGDWHIVKVACYAKDVYGRVIYGPTIYGMLN